MPDLNGRDKSLRGSAAQFFVAGELCRRGLVAVVTMGNTPNTDILVSNPEGTRFVHIQVKTFVPGNKTCSVGMKAEKNYGKRFFWVLAGVPHPAPREKFRYYVIPAAVIARQVKEGHALWLKTPGKKGQAHQDSRVRVVHLPPHKSRMTSWDISKYEERWGLIERKLK